MDSPAKVVLTDEGLGTLSAWLTDAIVEAYKRATDDETSNSAGETWLTGAEAHALAKELLGNDAPSLVMIGRQKKHFRWRQGEGRTKYEAEQRSFKMWLGSWNLDRSRRQKGSVLTHQGVHAFSTLSSSLSRRLRSSPPRIPVVSRHFHNTFTKNHALASINNLACSEPPPSNHTRGYDARDPRRDRIPQVFPAVSADRPVHTTRPRFQTGPREHP